MKLYVVILDNGIGTIDVTVFPNQEWADNNAKALESCIQDMPKAHVHQKEVTLVEHWPMTPDEQKTA